MSKPADQPPPSDMEVDAAAEEKPLVRFSINVLELMREAQMQHGLRHGDYTRYRFLHIVFYMAERAWSHAMEKKTAGPNAQQRIYMLGRFRKAVKWATLFSHLCSLKGDSRTSLEAEAYASYMKGTLLFEQEKNIEAAMTNFKNTRAVYEELGKYGSIENQLLCRQRIEEVEPMIGFCSRKLGGSALQAHELLDLEKEGPAYDLFKAKIEAVLSETRSQQAASMTEFSWLGRRFPITNAKTRVSILKAQQLEKDLNGANTESVPADKKLGIFDKIFSAYHDARSCIRNDLASAGNAENIRDELNGLDKAVSAVLGFRTIERNQLLVSIAKSKFTKHRDEKNEKITKPEELVRLYDLLIQNTTDLTDLISSGRDKNKEENTFIQEYELKSLAFRAERCFYLAKSYSSAGKRAEAYALFCHARSITDSALQQLTNSPDKALVQDLKALSDSCRSNSFIEHATGIMEEENVPERLSKGVSTLSLGERKEAFLLDMLESYESALGESNTKTPCHIARFPPPFQSVPCNPIVLDMAYNAIEFPNIENRMKKEKKGLLSRFWG
uniref:Signal recognition particle subunit SRP68 n=1 Tax=Oryza meridionalis TaxID=40149 RepID=A0A0E0E3J0_9ORYZ